MKLQKLLGSIPVLECTADPETEIHDICYDSRAVQPGDLFVAVSGYAVDGHKYMTKALEAGAVAVLCEHPPEQGAFIRVSDSRHALAEVSAAWFGYPARELTMVGVTGTNGKTTVTTLLKHVLEQTRGVKVGLVGTNGNMIGDTVYHTEHTTPGPYEVQKLLRAMADAGCEYGVMEVSSHSLVQYRVAGIRYRVGLFNNLTQDHLDFHKTMENYAEAKAMLFSQCDVGIVNVDDDWARTVVQRAKCPIRTLSAERNDCDYAAKDVRLSPSGVRFMALSGDTLARVSLGIPGKFSVYNALAVVAIASELGIAPEETARALSTALPVKGRAEVLPTDGDYTILIDYAVTPDAVANILDTVRDFAKGRVVFLFGCGGDRDRGKRPIMGRIAGEKADFVIVTSDNPRTEDPDAIIAEILPGLEQTRTPYAVRADRREAIEYAIENHRKDDLIILCGKGHEDYQIIGHEKIHMDEREIVAQILEKRKKTT